MAKKDAQRTLRRSFIREWRKQKGMTLDALAAAAQLDKGNLSKVERGLLPYNQEMLERIAKVLDTEPASLIAAEPTAQIFDIWERAPKDVQLQIVSVSEALVKASGGR